MKTIQILPFLAIVFGLVLSLNCQTVSTNEDEGLSAMLPTNDDIQDWERYLDSAEYLGEDLFFYINGGAEIYHEYGFERVIVQDYQNPDGRSVSLEVYKMDSPESAYGMYTFKSSGKGEELNVGHGGKLQDYYLNFWKGQFLVTITGFDEETETIDGIKSIAFVVDKKLSAPADVNMPVLSSLLIPKDLDTQSIQYFMGNLGLTNSYPFANTDIFEIQRGIKGSYAGGYDTYILEYEESESSQAVFENAKKDFRALEKYRSVEIGPNRIELEDSSGIRISVQPHRNFLLIVLNTKSPEQANQILKNLQDALN